MENKQGNRDKEEERRKRIFAQESSHWYYHNASPCHEVLKVKKRQGDPDEYRPATIADARKWKLLPSVTNLIGKFANKAGIEIWKRSILLDSITMELAHDLYMCAHDEEEREKVFKRISEAADAETGKYAVLGTLVHACIEKGIQKIAAGFDDGAVLTMVKEITRDTGFEESAGRITDIILGLRDRLIVFKGATIIQEKGFAFNLLLDDGTEFGLAGKVDLLVEYSAADVLAGYYPAGPAFENFGVLARDRAMKGLPTRLLLDFKTRKPNRLKGGGVSFPSYSSDLTQLSGYSEGAKYAAGFKPDACFNVFIASDAIRDLDLPEAVQFREYPASDIGRARGILKALASLWVAEERTTVADPYIPALNDKV
jgi:hypothetical protein